MEPQLTETTLRPSAEVVADVRRNLSRYGPEVAELLDWYEWLARGYRRALEAEAKYAEWLRDGKK